MTFKEAINRAIDDYRFVVVERRDKRTYILFEHWRYINYRDATRMLLCRCTDGKEGITYYSNKI